MSRKSFLEFINKSTLSVTEKGAISEAWDAEKRTLAAEMRDEFAQRFNEDKAKIIEGVQTMTDAVINEEMSKMYDEKRKLTEDRVAIRSKLQKFSQFSNEILSEEVKELRSDRVALGESLKLFAEFSNEIISEEVVDFRKEKSQLIEARVKLISEGKKQINEAKHNFIMRASTSAEKFIIEQTKSELSELKTQINEASNNMFGRKIFEAFATEFMGTQYREGSELRKLNESIVTLTNEKEEMELKSIILETEVEKSRKKINIIESSHKREGIMSMLLKPLNKQQQHIMEGLLEQTPNNKLTEGYNKYLGAVLKQDAQPVNRSPKGTRSKLTESTHNGDRSKKPSAKPITPNIDQDFEAELLKITNLAGFTK